MFGNELRFLLLLLDKVIHDQICNPIAGWLQRWLHVNRYHLLFAGGLSNVFLLWPSHGLGAVMNIQYYGWTSFCVLQLVMAVAVPPLVYGLGSLREYFTALFSALRRFEDVGFGQPSDVLIRWARTAKRLRPYLNLFALFDVFALWLIWLVPGTLNEWPFCFLLLHAEVASLCVFVFDLHMWDVDDLDPRDREYLFSPQERDARN
jgi:hypothetical protein